MDPLAQGDDGVAATEPPVTTDRALGGGAGADSEATAGDDEVVVPWELRSATPDGRVLLLDVVPQNCETPTGLVVAEGDDEVEVTALATPLAEGLGCAQVLIAEPAVVRLEAPVGERRLAGCLPPGGRAGCRDSSEVAGARSSLLDGDLVVAVEAGAVVGRAAGDGRELWRTPLPREGHARLRAVAGGILAIDDGLTLLDRGDGRVLASVEPGWVGPHTDPVGEDPLVVRDRGSLRILHGLDPRDLTRRWSTEIADADNLAHVVVPLANGATAAQADRSGGASALVVLDAAGTQVRRAELPDGAIAGIDGDAVVHAGADGRLRRLDSHGTVLTASAPVPGRVSAVSDGLAYIERVDAGMALLAVDLISGDTRWRWEHDGLPWLWSTDPHLVLDTSDALVLDALSPEDGVTAWRIDLTGSLVVDDCDADRILALPAATLAVRAADGCVAWWTPVPLDGLVAADPSRAR